MRPQSGRPAGRDPGAENEVIWGIALVAGEEDDRHVEFGLQIERPC